MMPFSLSANLDASIDAPEGALAAIRRKAMVCGFLLSSKFQL